MDDAGLFFPLSSSEFIFKLSETKKKQEEGEEWQMRVFGKDSFDRNGGTLKIKATNSTIQTSDCLGSKDLLVLQWYMEMSGLYRHKSWTLANMPKYHKIRRSNGNFMAEPSIASENDMKLPEHCCIAHKRILEVVNDIRIMLDKTASPSSRLPKGGAGGLVFFLCRSRAMLPSGPYRKWCNIVIHHFDPEDEDQVDQLSDTFSSQLTVSNSSSKSTKKKKQTKKKEQKEPSKLVAEVTLAHSVVDLTEHEENSSSEELWELKPTLAYYSEKKSPERCVFVARIPSNFTEAKLVECFENKGFFVEKVAWKTTFAFVTFKEFQSVTEVLSKPVKYFPFVVKEMRK